MQQKIKGLNDQRDGLRKEVSNIEKHAHDHNNVIINVFKESLEVIVSTKCEDVEGDEGLPLSKVLQCLIQEGLDVVSAISKKVNTNYVHCIHAQVSILHEIHRVDLLDCKYKKRKVFRDLDQQILKT